MVDCENVTGRSFIFYFSCLVYAPVLSVLDSTKIPLSYIFAALNLDITLLQL